VVVFSSLTSLHNRLKQRWQSLDVTSKCLYVE
jgi:hypothetical protein